MDDKRIEKIILNVNANLSIEGMPLTNNDKIRMRDCLTGKTTVDYEVKKLVEKYTVKKV
ncbi:MAG: hypothetical protein SA378_03630 [Sedimentibacter sp.]|uniref:hypothetical protein n=1 Tax=Sedimentibacter sp. TaxID=1960295 RepID=UPI002981853C|nr:hypothetical protein [Sedimentibacter sp.]MDW5299212.1 hypothetical protein [Sedimentibacter sp.]